MTIASRRRSEGLRQILNARRRTIQDDVDSRRHNGRASRSDDVCDAIDASDAERRREIEFALLQMSTETLILIDMALVQLDAGQYGACPECGGDIAEQRLQALPFALRCVACEEQHEQQRRASRLAQRRDTFVPFMNPLR